MGKKIRKCKSRAPPPDLHFNRILWRWAYTLMFEKHLLKHFSNIIPTLHFKRMSLAAMTCIGMLLQDRGQ